MKLAYLASRYPAPSQAFLGREIRGLRQAGVEVETISIRKPGPDELLTEEDRAEAERTFYVLPAGPLKLLGAQLAAIAHGPHYWLLTLMRALRLSAPGFRAHLWALFYFAEAMVVRRHCRSLGISHIHAVQFADGAGDVALLAAHRSYTDGEKWTFSLTVHGPGEFYEVARYGLAEKVRRAHLTVAVSEFTRSQLIAQVEEWHAAHVQVVHMGVEPERFPERPDSGRTGSEARVLCVARLVRHKGQATLLRAVAQLRDEGLELHTTLVGGGPARQELEALRDELGLGGLVELAGVVGQDELPGLYREADIFCLPTLAEAVGVVNMEAMASGLPVVASDLMGVPELVEDEVTGLLVPPGRENELGEALRRLASDPELRQRLGSAGRAKVTESFDSAREAERLSRLLGEFVP